MKNLRLVFFSLFSLTLAASASAYEMPEKAFTIGGFIGMSHHITGASYSRVPQDSDKRALNYNARRLNTGAIMLMGSYSIVDKFQVEAQYVTNLHIKHLSDTTLLKQVDHLVTANSTYASSPLKVSNQAAGVFGVFKIGTEAFFKARLGFGFSSAEFKSSNAKQEYSQAGIAYGLSIGQQFDHHAFELMWVRYPDIVAKSGQLEDRFGIKNTRPDPPPSDPNAGPPYKSTEFSASRRQKLEYFMLGYTYSF